VLTKQRQQLQAEARDLEARLNDIQEKSRLGTITEAEEAEIPYLADKAEALKARAQRLFNQEASDGVREMFEAINPTPDDQARPGKAQTYSQGSQPGRGGLRWADGKSWGDHLLAQQSDGRGFKALAPVGAIVTPLPAPGVIPIGAPVMHLRQLIPTQPASPAFSFLQQTVRTDAAAPVAVGAAKPVSDFQTTLISGRAQVVATLSNPVDRFLLGDAPNLRDFLNSEMTYAVEVAVENSILNGLGTDLIVGFLNTSGVLLQAFATDMIVTIANAISLVERTGVPVNGVVMNYADWLTLTLIKTTYGQYLVGEGAPVETTAQRIWGRPVVLSVKMPASKALVGDFAGSSKLFVADGGQVLTQWTEAAIASQGPPVLTAFAFNQLVFRSETRLNLGVLRPAGFCIATLA
jgi:HK97 family phage major capsid protein